MSDHENGDAAENPAEPEDTGPEDTEVPDDTEAGDTEAGDTDPEGTVNTDGPENIAEGAGPGLAPEPAPTIFNPSRAMRNAHTGFRSICGPRWTTFLAPTRSGGTTP